MSSGKEETVLRPLFGVLTHYKQDVVDKSRGERKPVNISV